MWRKLALWKKILLLVVGAPIVLVALLLLSAIRPDLPAAEVDAKYTNDASRFIELETGARVHVRDEGNAEGPAIMLVHGSHDSLHTWEGWVPHLAKDFRVVSLDLPAFGLTGRVPDDDYSQEAFVRTMRGVARALGLERFAVAGNSMGGHAAWRYALTHPEDVTKLILVDASGFPQDGPPPPWLRFLQLPGVAPLMRWLDPRPLVESGFEKAVADPSLMTEAVVDRSVDFIRRQGSRDALRLRRQQSSRASSSPVARLGEIQAPTLIMWGKLDALVSPKDAYKFKKRIENSRVIMYEGVGHLPMREIPERSARDLIAFLREPAEEAVARTEAPDPAIQDSSEADPKP